MGIDFQVAFPVELVEVSQVRAVPGLPVRTLDILGTDFRAVDEVLMNDVPSPSFIVLSNNRLLAEVPDVLKRSTITSIGVLSRRITITKRSTIRFRVNDTPGKVRGLLRLVQLFLKLLFTTPGTDIFAKNLGGGALARLGQTVGTDEGADVVANLVVSVDNTGRQLLQIQARDPSIPPDERFMAAKVHSAGFNKNETALVATVELLSQAGQSAIARIEM